MIWNLMLGYSIIQRVACAFETTKLRLIPRIPTSVVITNPAMGPLRPRSYNASLFTGGSLWEMTAPRVPPMPGGAGMK